MTPPKVETLPADFRTAWQRGKLDAECPACGRREAASARCSGCFRPYQPGDYMTHADPRALHYQPGRPARFVPAALQVAQQAVSAPDGTTDTATPYRPTFALFPEEDPT